MPWWHRISAHPLESTLSARFSYSSRKLDRSAGGAYLHLPYHDVRHKQKPSPQVHQRSLRTGIDSTYSTCIVLHDHCTSGISHTDCRPQSHACKISQHHFGRGFCSCAHICPQKQFGPFADVADDDAFFRERGAPHGLCCLSFVMCRFAYNTRRTLPVSKFANDQRQLVGSKRALKQSVHRL